ncbi:MCP methyltransferase, CheR-type [[Bacillus] selenitireducens MLS10]|uniref:protein-glutamate O-methyltransferase n=2 Tax=Salisediminibacterium selenitireducens TaxID=85683 RepID=D6XV96_BACIE|nr:protein-glutamate O-methyltransferase CheR [Salisediminibacterium selenitireducens]ADH99634.1 MCP methyltransferase, CheR-type [[Bacillus] selenitireducens MLS10]
MPMDDYNQFVEKIRKKTGIDLSLYKEAQMKRRLTSLRDKRNFKTFNDYFESMTKDQELFEEFLQRMTINVSEFFRNPQRWDVLETVILPRLMKESSKLKVWSAACSTGEEPYSLVMLLRKYLSDRQFDVTATDLDQSILDRAIKGFYPERSIKDVPKDMLTKYFHIDKMGYKVTDDVKNQIRFRRHNLLADSYDKGFDLIVCRNVMIYFTEQAKEEIYMNFSRALKPGGVLFVGSTEQIFNPQRFGLEAEQTFFYKKIKEV